MTSDDANADTPEDDEREAGDWPFPEGVEFTLPAGAVTSVTVRVDPAARFECSAAPPGTFTLAPGGGYVTPGEPPPDPDDDCPPHVCRAE